MESNRVVFDVSSDDEESTSAWQEPKGNDYDWLWEVLGAVDKGFDDPDEVLVVGEVNPNKGLKSWNSSVRKVVEENDDDDDCVVLEGDPDKALSNVNDPQEDSDELLIVGQKGQIACRDFPHPRHDCAKFPFSSTSHEQHCELCHCFVCDMQAPCRYWGSGVCDTDHCHATDKKEIWNTLRKNLRLGRNVPISVAKAPVISHSTAVPQLTHAPLRNIIQLKTQNQVLRLTPARAAGNCIPRPSIIRACSSSTSRSVGSRHVVNKSTTQPRSVSQQLLGVHSTIIRRDRGIKISNVDSLFVPFNTLSQRLGAEVASTMNCTAYAPSGNITSAHASQNQQTPASVTNFCSGANFGTYAHQSSTQPSMYSVFTNSAPSKSSASSQPVPQSDVHQDTNHLQNQNQTASNYGFSDFDFNWVDSISQSNQQPSVDYLQLQYSGSASEKEPVKEVNEGDKSYFNDLESFLFDLSVPGNSLTAEITPPSPDSVSFDTGMRLFDIDASWDRLNSCLAD